MSSDDVIFVKTCIILDDKIDVVVRFPATSDKRVFATIAGICVILTFTAIYLNACTVVTIWKTPELKEKLSKFTIMMQSTVDLLHGVFVMPLFIYLVLGEVTETESCLVAYVYKRLMSLIFLFSLTTFSALNHERYMGICHPIFHRTRVKKRHLLNYVVAVCTLLLLGFCSSFFYVKISRPILSLLSLAFLAHTIFVYVKIARAIQTKVRVNENQRGKNQRRKLIQYFSEIKAAKTCFFIVICCIFCNLPITVTFGDVVEVNVSFETVLLRKCLIVLVMLNSSLNSVILFWRDKKLRMHAKTALKCSRR